MVLAADASRQTVVVSHNSIPGYMEAMAMPFRARPAGVVEGLHRGDMVSFTLVVDRKASWLEDLRVTAFDSAERDPVQASRLKLLDSLMSRRAATMLAPGQPVPDFTLTAQDGRAVSLSQFRGKVVALNFIYTRCPLPDYCFRLSNNFGRLQKRFTPGRDLVLLTVTFDPANDRPDVLARYGQVWKAIPGFWYFLTGSATDVERVCGSFGVAAWPDEGLLTHSLHTAVVDREGKLAANLEGNRYSAQQLGDLVEAIMMGR
jgi:protein SCO1/2